MDYYIHTDIKTKCDTDFPNGLSYFFEQLDGYGNNSLVAQISEKLNIDLSIFQDYDYMTDDPDEEKKFWKDINVFIELVNEFIDKLVNNKNLLNSIKYNSKREIDFNEIRKNISINPNDTKIDDLVKYFSELESHYQFPENDGYIENNELLDDLNKFKVNLNCYKKNGVKKIKLMYI